MKKFLTCLIQGHDYELISHNSFKPRLGNIESEGALPFSVHAGLIGYTKTVQICKRCGKVNITQSLGE